MTASGLPLGCEPVPQGLPKAWASIVGKSTPTNKTRPEHLSLGTLHAKGSKEEYSCVVPNTALPPLRGAMRGLRNNTGTILKTV